MELFEHKAFEMEGGPMDGETMVLECAEALYVYRDATTTPPFIHVYEVAKSDNPQGEALVYRGKLQSK